MYVMGSPPVQLHVYIYVSIQYIVIKNGWYEQSMNWYDILSVLIR